MIKLSRELNLIVTGTTESFAECGIEGNETQEVVESESNHNQKINSEIEVISNSAFIDEHLHSKLEYHALEHGRDVILFDGENSEPIYQPEVDPLSDVVSVKYQALKPIVKLVPLVLKTEKPLINNETHIEEEIIPVAFFDEKESRVCSKCNISSDTENHVCLFRCDLCPYTAKYSAVLGQHKWRVHRIFGKSNPAFLKKKLSVFGNGKRFRCNLCPYTANSIQVIGQHRRRVHKILGIRSKASIDKPITIRKEPQLHEKELNTEEQNLGNTELEPINHEEKQRVTRTQRSKDSRVKQITHKLRKHHIQTNIKTIADIDTHSAAEETKEKPQQNGSKKKEIEYKKQFYNFPRYLKFSSNLTSDVSCKEMPSISSAENRILSQNEFSADLNTTLGSVHEIYQNIDGDNCINKSHLKRELVSQVLKHDDVDIIDDISMSSDAGSLYTTSAANNLNPEPLILGTETLDENTWIDIENQHFTKFSEKEIETCLKCNMPYDPNNHVCSFKCDNCSFTSRYRKVIVKHKLQEHKSFTKTKNQTVADKLYKCDLCSFTSKYIQAIGKHKRNVHNVIGKASEQFLMKKKCVIGNMIGKLFKCEYCSFTAKYIQNIGVHKKRMHETVDRTSKQSRKETSDIETGVPGSEDDSQNANDEIHNSWIDVADDTIENLSGQKQETCLKCYETCELSTGNHNCSFKCDLCSFTSRYRKVILNHKLREHEVVIKPKTKNQSVYGKLLKCELCSFTSRKRKDIASHKIQVHKDITKPKNQSITSKLFKCDLCSFTARYIQSIGKHKRKVHNIAGQASEKFLMKKRCIIGNKFGKLFKCEFCSYTAKYIQNIGVHKKQMHEVADRTSEKFCLEASSVETEVPEHENDSEIVNQETITTILANVDTILSSDGTTTNQYECELYPYKNGVPGSEDDTQIANDEIHNSWIDVADDTIENVSGQKQETCLKCYETCELSNHNCSFKCDLCSFTSRYRKVILNHKLREHEVVIKPKTKNQSVYGKLLKCELCSFTSRKRKDIASHKIQVHKDITKPKNQSITSKLFKCDLCSFTARYIQSIGKHKRKVHNIAGKASVKFLMKKRCIIENNFGKLFKCEFCSYTAKYIQNIGVHKKQMHEVADRTSEKFCLETSSVETEVPEHENDSEIVNQEIKTILANVDTPLSSDGTTTNQYECELYPYKNKSKDELRMCKRKINNIKIKIKRDSGSAVKVSNVTSSKTSDTERNTSQLNTGDEGKLVENRKMYKKKNKPGGKLGGNDPETKEYKCKLCPYQSASIGALKKHRWLKHNDQRKIKKTAGSAVKVSNVTSSKTSDTESNTSQLNTGDEGKLVENRKMYKKKNKVGGKLGGNDPETKEYKCKLCPYQSASIGALKKHRWLKHNDQRKIKKTAGELMKEKIASKVKGGGQERYICKCRKIYTNKPSFISHVKYHCMQEPRQRCHHCNYKTHRRSEVLRHLRQVHKLKIPYNQKKNLNIITF